MKAKYPVLIAAFVIVFLAGTLIPTALTQSETENPYVMVNYMKVDPAKEAEYVEMETDTWKPIHQKRVSDGKLLSWSLYSVRFPRGDNMEYGYLTVEIYKNIGDAEGNYGNDDFKALLKTVHPDRSPDGILKEALSKRSLVRSELLRLIDRTN